MPIEEDRARRSSHQALRASSCRPQCQATAAFSFSHAVRHSVGTFASLAAMNFSAASKFFASRRVPNASVCGYCCFWPICSTRANRRLRLDGLRPGHVAEIGLRRDVVNVHQRENCQR